MPWPQRAEDARIVRIENGKPRYGEDIRETTLPQETQQMHAVSFNKGCYHRAGDRGADPRAGPGEQEADARGAGGAEAPPAGTKTTVDGQRRK